MCLLAPAPASPLRPCPLSTGGKRPHAGGGSPAGGPAGKRQKPQEIEKKTQVPGKQGHKNDAGHKPQAAAPPGKKLFEPVVTAPPRAGDAASTNWEKLKQARESQFASRRMLS